MKQVSVDVVSDVVCPWCYLGKARLDKAIAAVSDDIGVHVTWRPYRLNPDYPPEGVDHQKVLAEKLGGKERMEQIHATLSQYAADAGISFNFEAIKVGPNTLDAHRLIYWAGIESREIQDRIVTALFRANFEQGRNIGDHAVLVEIAKEAGMDAAVTERLLASGADKDTIVAEVDAAQKMGVSGVPFFIVNGKYGISGAQTPDVLENALRQIAEEDGDEEDDGQAEA